MLVAAIYGWAFIIVIIRRTIFKNREVHILELVFPAFQFCEQILRCQEVQ